MLFSFIYFSFFLSVFETKQGKEQMKGKKKRGLHEGW